MSHLQYSSNKPYLFRAILDWLLDNDATPYILVDASCAHVEVPKEHVKDGQIVLNINPSAVQNWHVDQDGISFYARFSGAARQIYVPMAALMAIYSQENGQGMAFPSHLSESSETGEQPSPQKKSDRADTKFSDANSKKNEQSDGSNTKLKVDSSSAKPAKVAKLNPKKSSHLKVVK